MLREIGSNFWENPSLEGENPKNRFWWQESGLSVRYLKSGRNAIKACCRIIGSPKKALLPAYTCETVIQPFLDEGWDVRYYAIRPDLSIDEESVRTQVEQFHPDLFLFHSFFGFDTVKYSAGLLEDFSEQGVLLLEDLTQGLLSGIHTDIANYFISSLRKFVAMPEGGILVMRDETDIPGIHAANPDIIGKARETWGHKAAYMQGGEPTLKDRFRKEYGELEAYIDENDFLQEMNKDAVQVFHIVDLHAIGSKRRENFERIARGTTDIPWIRPIFREVAEDEVPLYFPFYTETDRERLQRYLGEQNIYCPVIWPKPEMMGEMDPDTESMYRKMLCIPIDQRYGAGEMDYILENLHEYPGE